MSDKKIKSMVMAAVMAALTYVATTVIKIPAPTGGYVHIGEKKEKPQKDALSVNYVEEAARELGEKLGRPCRIVNGKKKGRIELEYYGTEDLNALLEALEKLGKR